MARQVRCRTNGLAFEFLEDAAYWADVSPKKLARHALSGEPLDGLEFEFVEGFVYECAGGAKFNNLTEIRQALGLTPNDVRKAIKQGTMKKRALLDFHRIEEMEQARSRKPVEHPASNLYGRCRGVSCIRLVLLPNTHCPECQRKRIQFQSKKSCQV